jgi:hypothetical protein
VDEDTLRDKARAVIRSGKLPRRRPDRTSGGPGVGAECAVCRLPVAQDELEFEIQFARDGDNPDLDKFHVHVRCFSAWEFERRSSATSGRLPRDTRHVAAVVGAPVADSGRCLRCIAMLAEVSESRAGNIIADLQRSIAISETSERCEKCGDSTVTYKLG